MTGHPKNNEFELRLWALHPGAHICCLFGSEAEHRTLLAPFIRHGLERYERVLYIVDAHTAEQILAYLRADGVQVNPFIQNGQLRILDADAFYTRSGVFDPEDMIALLRAETERAIKEGYSALRFSAEMNWALKGLPGSERLIEYEVRLNTFFPGSGCLALCQYDRRRFDPHVLLEVLEAHPLAAVGTEVYDNFYYMPPQEMLGADPLGQKLSSWLDHLRERKRSETQIRTLTRKLMKTQEDERRMISRELHDRVSQDLSTIKIALETLFDQQPAAAPEIGQKVSRLTGLLDHAIFTVRDLSYDLRPPGLDEMGIAQALVMYCDDFSEKTRIRVECHCVGIEKLKLDFNTQINLYRMIQEGLNNTHKHADATRATVKLTAVYPNIILRIEDDGKGFDVEKRVREMDSEKRMGLRSLQERADLLGGIMIVTSKPEQGTKILIKIPYTG
jgi:signal transduction histidine kinase